MAKIGSFGQNWGYILPLLCTVLQFDPSSYLYYLHWPPQGVIVFPPDHVDEEAQVLLIALSDGHVAPEVDVYPKGYFNCTLVTGYIVFGYIRSFQNFWTQFLVPKAILYNRLFRK